MAKFKGLYGGKDYVIHFKFSNILNIVYITMMYGIGMPILFPIAMFNFLNQYVSERIIVAYYMKQPPALDDKLIRNCLHMLKWAPLLLLSNGFWMVSNQQIFNNVYHFINEGSESMKSNHFFQINKVTHAEPLLLFAFACIALIFIFVFARDWMIRLGFTLGQTDIEIDEDLPNFFKAVSLSQANEVVERDHYLKLNYGFE
jgi:hypothetical protein